MADTRHAAEQTAETEGPFNWLKGLDEEAIELEPAWHWLEPYDPFMLVRYERLQPSDIGPERGRMWSGSRRAFFEPIHNFLRLLPSQNDDVRTIFGRSEFRDERRRHQLACLILEVRDELEQYRSQRSTSEEIDQLAELERSAERARKAECVKSLRVADKALRRALQQLEPPNDGTASATDQIQQHEGDVATVIGRCLTVLSSVIPSKSYRELKQFRNQKLREGQGWQNPLTFGMVRLYWFFRHECGLSGNLSEIFTGRLRNTFWTPDKPVEIENKSDIDQGRGCGAVWQAVLSYRPESEPG
jgi:hypothetical protein